MVLAKDTPSNSSAGIDMPAPVVLTKFAQRAPQVKTSGVKSKDERKETERLAFMQIISLLEQNLDRCPLVLTQLHNDLGKSAEREEDDSRWPSTYHQLYRLPKYYKGTVLAMASEKLTSHHIEAINMQDHEALETAFYLMTQTREQTPLPWECLDKEVCTEFWLQRLKIVGARIDKWVERALRVDGTIDWKAGMAYELKYDGDDNLCEVLHVFSGVIAPVAQDPPVKKSPTFLIEHPEDEMLTCLKGGKWLSIHLASLFEDGKGPHEHSVISKKSTAKRARTASPFFDLAKKVHDEILERRASQQKVHDEQKEESVKACLQKGDEQRAKDRLQKLEAGRSKATKRTLQIQVP